MRQSTPTLRMLKRSVFASSSSLALALFGLTACDPSITGPTDPTSPLGISLPCGTHSKLPLSCTNEEGTKDYSITIQVLCDSQNKATEVRTIQYQDAVPMGVDCTLDSTASLTEVAGSSTKTQTEWKVESYSSNGESGKRLVMNCKESYDDGSSSSFKSTMMATSLSPLKGSIKIENAYQNPDGSISNGENNCKF